jgi:flagellar biosynthesis protein FlgN
LAKESFLERRSAFMKAGPTGTPLTGLTFNPAVSIAEERDATRKFIDVLEQEQHLLQQTDVSLLLSLAKEKAVQAQQLIRLADARNQWLQKLGYPRDRSGMERGITDCNCPGATDAWHELLQLAKTASQLNKINGTLITQRLRYNHQALTVLQAATHTAGLYGSDGQPQLFSSGRQLGEG